MTRRPALRVPVYRRRKPNNRFLVHYPVLKKLFLQSELFVTVFCYAGTMLIKLVSSIIMTRILAPEAYGIITILMSIIAFVEMFSDLGMYAVMVRHERGDDQVFINTMWSIRLIRCLINGTLIFIFAPLAAKLYSTPILTDALRIYALVFVIHGCGSMAFMLAARHGKTRITSYAELCVSLITTPLVIVYTQYSRDFYGIVYGALLQGFLMTLVSHFFYRAQSPRFQIEAAARVDLFNFSKIVIPSSMLAFILSQFERIIFLKLFDLRLFGLFGVAGNMAGPLGGLISQVSRTVLFTRSAQDLRAHRPSAHIKFYLNNLKLYAVLLAPTPIAAGAADLIVQVLYDERYAYAGVILQAFLLRTALNSLAAPAEDLLVAAGHTRVVLMGNVLRLCWLIPGSLLGYYFFGFRGFLYAGMLEPLPTLLYLWSFQFRERMMIVQYECYKVVFVAALFVASWFVSSQFSAPGLRQYLKSLF